MNSRVRTALVVLLIVVSFSAGSFTRVGPYLAFEVLAPLAQSILRPTYRVILAEAHPPGGMTARVVAVAGGGATVDYYYDVVLANTDEAAIDASRKNHWIWSSYGLAPSAMRWLRDDILELELSVNQNVGMGRLGSVERRVDRGILVIERVRVVEDR